MWHLSSPLVCGFGLDIHIEELCGCSYFVLTERDNKTKHQVIYLCLMSLISLRVKSSFEVSACHYSGLNEYLSSEQMNQPQ